jgi:membrane protease YdiL (CAAX protease family)
VAVVAPVALAIAFPLALLIWRPRDAGLAAPVLLIYFGAIPAVWAGTAAGAWLGLRAGGCERAGSTALLVVPSIVVLALLEGALLVAAAIMREQQGPGEGGETSAWTVGAIVGLFLAGIPLEAVVLARLIATRAHPL